MHPVLVTRRLLCIILSIIPFSVLHSSDLFASFETSGGTLAYGTFDSSTLVQTGANVLPNTGDTRGLTLDSAGNIYIGRIFAGFQSQIYKYNAAGALLLTSPTIGANVEDFAIGQDGVLRVSFETSAGALAYGTFNTATLVQTGTNLLPATGDTRGLSVDSTGNIYIGRVFSGFQSQIYKYNSAGSLLTTSPTIGAAVEDFVIGQDGVLRVSFETSTGTLAYGSFNPSTLAQTGTVILPDTGDTRGLTMDEFGNIYVGRVFGGGFQSQIYKYNSSGSLLNTSPTINAAVEDFVIAVPEPGSMIVVTLSATALFIVVYWKRRNGQRVLEHIVA